MNIEINRQDMEQVQKELVANITQVRSFLNEWLIRPQNSEIDVVIDLLEEVHGVLLVLNHENIAELTKNIWLLLGVLQEKAESYSEIDSEFFDNVGGCVAFSLLILEDYINNLGFVSELEKQNVANNNETLVRLLSSGVYQNLNISAGVQIDRNTYEALAKEVEDVIGKIKSAIEKSIDRGTDLNFAPLVNDNNELINIFSLLELKAPQLLLDYVNYLFGDALDPSDWIAMAEALILVSEALKEFDFNEVRLVDTVKQAREMQLYHSRILQIKTLGKLTARDAFGYFEKIRKEMSNKGKLPELKQFYFAAQQISYYSSINLLIKNNDFTQVLNNLGACWVEIGVKNSVDEQALFPVIVNVLVAIESLFFGQSFDGMINDGYLQFLAKNVDNLSKLVQVSEQSLQIYQSFALMSSVEQVENDKTADEFADTLSSLSSFDFDFDFDPFNESPKEPESLVANPASVLHGGQNANSASGGGINPLASNNFTVTQQSNNGSSKESISFNVNSEFVVSDQSANDLPGSTIVTNSVVVDRQSDAVLDDGSIKQQNKSPSKGVNKKNSVPSQFIPFFSVNNNVAALEGLSVPESKQKFLKPNEDAVIDEEIREFFVEEFSEIVENALNIRSSWQKGSNLSEDAQELRRAFHTLKGSGRTVGYESLAEFAWQQERLLNQVLEGTLSASKLLRETIVDALDLLAILQGQDPFVEYKAAFLLQAEVSEKVLELLLDNPDLGDDEQSFVNSSFACRLSANPIEEEQSEFNQDNADEFVSEFSVQNDYSMQSDFSDFDSSGDSTLLQENIRETVFANPDQQIPADSSIVKERVVVKEYVKSDDQQIADSSVVVKEKVVFTEGVNAGNQQSFADSSKEQVFVKEYVKSDDQQIADSSVVVKEKVVFTEGVKADDQQIADLKKDDKIVVQQVVQQVGANVSFKSDNQSLAEQLVNEVKPESIENVQLSISEDVIKNLSLNLSGGEADSEVMQGLAKNLLSQWGGDANDIVALTDFAEKVSQNDLLSEASQSLLVDSLLSQAQLLSREEIANITSQQINEQLARERESIGESSQQIVDQIDSLNVDQSIDQVNSIKNVGGDSVSMSASKKITNQPAFYNALDKFDYLSSNESYYQNPQGISELLDTVYDIEANLDESAPNWAWRVLESLESFISYHLSNQKSIKSDASQVLKEAIELLENSQNYNSEMAEKSINSLLNMRVEAAADIDGFAKQNIAQDHPVFSQAIKEQLQQELANIYQSNKDPFVAKSLNPLDDQQLAMVDIFLEEARHLISCSISQVERWSADLSNLSHLDALRREIHTLKGGARILELSAMSDLAHAIETLLNQIFEGYNLPREQASKILMEALGQFSVMLSEVNDGYMPRPSLSVINEIALFLDLPLPYSQEFIDAFSSDVQASEIQSAESDKLLEEDYSITDPVPFDEAVDPVFVDIFVDEAEDLLAGTIQNLNNDITDSTVVDELNRILHTLKGGANMVGFKSMGEVAHLMESVVLNLPSLNSSEIEQAKSLLMSGYSGLRTMLDSVLRKEMPSKMGNLQYSLREFAQEGRFVSPNQMAIFSPPSEDIQDSSVQDDLNIATQESASSEIALQEENGSSLVAPEAWADEEKPVVVQEKVEQIIEQVVVEQVEVPVKTEVVKQEIIKTEQKVVNEQPAISSSKPAFEAVSPAPKKADNKHYVRVDADLLDKMISAVGEVVVLQSRMQNILSTTDFNLSELTRISSRVNDQLRRLTTETESQILFKKEKYEAETGDFDPLEMDRFTEIQELSRQLAEAVDDLRSVQDALGSGTLSLQGFISKQSNLNRALQEDLQTTQLLRFDIHESRLQRLVQHVSAASSKKVALVIEGGSFEIERRLYDDLLPALEHMIRNSIAHGIEKPADRSSLGKPQSGTVKISIENIANEIVVRISDDGAGINYEALKKKARDRGILDESRANDETYLSKLIFQAGLSTAKEVTQIAGRGVGMDVVNEMLHSRRGRINVSSVKGEGTTMTINLPISISLAEVLLVEIAGDSYVIPMTNVRSVEYLDKVDLQKSLSGEIVSHKYQDKDYKVHLLGKYFSKTDYTVGDDPAEHPLFLVDVGDEPIAFHVDRIVSRMETLIKGVNRQVLNVLGISGATILGDGRVVPVLELADLARRIDLLQNSKEVETAEVEKAAQRVLVVDDSVTMRKVSSRLLERNNFEVATAKDGLDAIEVIKDFTPDVILLDIEMPRMDGFEFASYVRKESDIPDVPIVMITSRTGDKHRHRADGLGVNAYLGKPYREEVLLETLEKLFNGAQ